MNAGGRRIGAVARQSGLSVSALRFYDAADVLRPARVDPATGYRWYTADQVAAARLIASLRRVSMPLTDICEVLAVRHLPIEAGHLLDRHLSRLEDGLVDARGQLDIARELIATEEKSMSYMTVRGADLAAGVAAVRFAISADPNQPALNGVLFDYDGATLRLVASDRYRLAVATVETRQPRGPARRLIAPASLLDVAPSYDDPVTIELTGRTITIGGHTAEAIDAAFPDYQRLLRTAPTESVRVTAANLVELVSSGPTRTVIQAPNNAPHEISVVLIGKAVEVIDNDHPDAIGLNREFFLQALDAAGAEELVLAFDGPMGPLAISDPARHGDVSLLMPTKLT